MTIELYWEPTLYFIIVSILWIFRDTTLILWARAMKKRETKSKYVNLLLFAGIILLVWSIIYVFLPGFRSYNSPTEFETVGIIFFLYDLIPIILGVFLGIVLSIYFYNVNEQHNIKALLGPGIFLVGYIIDIFFTANFYFSIIENPLLLLVVSNYNAYIIGLVIFDILPVVGFCFIFLFSLHRKNEFLIMFCGLFFAYLTLSLIHNLNFVMSNFNFYG